MEPEQTLSELLEQKVVRSTLIDIAAHSKEYVEDYTAGDAWKREDVRDGWNSRFGVVLRNVFERHVLNELPLPVAVTASDLVAAARSALLSQFGDFQSSFRGVCLNVIARGRIRRTEPFAVATGNFLLEVPDDRREHIVWISGVANPFGGPAFHLFLVGSIPTGNNGRLIATQDSCDVERTTEDQDDDPLRGTQDTSDSDFSIGGRLLLASV